MPAGAFVLSHAKSIAVPQRRAMVKLMIACNLLWSKSFTPELLATTHRLVVEAVAQVQT
jgi:hypothetical protein